MPKNHLTLALLKTFSGNGKPNDKKKPPLKKNAIPTSLTGSPTVTTRSASRATNSYAVGPDANPCAGLLEDPGRKLTKMLVGSGKPERPIELLKDALKLLEESQQMRDNAVGKILECLQFLSRSW